MGRHSKPNDTTTTMKRVALGASLGLGAAVVPTTFAGTAHAASEDAWERIAACESGDKNVPGSGRWNLPFGHASSTGGLQIQLATWNDFGGQEYASAPYLATKAQQIAIAERILAGQGPGAWVCNSPGHGIASGALSGQPGNSSATATPTPKPTPPPAPKPVPKPPVSSEPSDAEDGVYVVKRGDWLSKIACRLRLDGGWKRLYEINRETVGPNPNRILPGQKLRLPGHEAPAPAAPKPTPKPTPPPAPSTDYVMPVQGTLGDSLIVGSGGSMSRAYGGHSGLDISAPQGTPVKSVAAGTVVSINSSGSPYGLHVVVKHADGKYTLYAHMSAITVNVGQSVSVGQQVGNVGSTGTSSGPHLHFEVRTDPTAFNSGIFLEPKAYLRSHGVSI